MYKSIEERGDLLVDELLAIVHEHGEQALVAERAVAIDDVLKTVTPV